MQDVDKLHSRLLKEQDELQKQINLLITIVPRNVSKSFEKNQNKSNVNG